MTSATGTEPAPAVVLPTHEQGLALFDLFLDTIKLAGWTRQRIDTFVHPLNATHARSAMTVRHHYTHGTWELYYEPDRYWNRNGVPSVTKTAQIRLDRPLPTVERLVDDLFGSHVGRYWPAPAVEPAPKRQSRPSRSKRTGVTVDGIERETGERLY